MLRDRVWNPNSSIENERMYVIVLQAHYCHVQLAVVLRHQCVQTFIENFD